MGLGATCGPARKYSPVVRYEPRAILMPHFGQ
jgi:hypothetical protein